jgi:hypothetical protein
MRIGRHPELIKVDVKIVSDHPYPWHSEVRKQHPEDLQNQKIQTEVAELINPESQTPQSKIKNAGTNPFFLKLNKKYLSNIGEGIFLLSNHLFTS